MPVRAIMAALALAAVQAQPPVAPTPPVREAATTWVAYKAETTFTRTGASDQFGRYLQDEHGCNRHDMVEADGRAQIVINNYETGRMYHFGGGSWTSAPIRMLPATPRRPPQSMGRVVGKVAPIDGFDVLETEMVMRSPRGDSTTSLWVVPALNFLVARRTYPDGRIETVTSVKTGAPAPADFLPPPGANVVEGSGFRGGTFQAVVVQVTFAGQQPMEITTTESRPAPLRMPDGQTLGLTTLVSDRDKDTVRVTLNRLPVGGPPPRGAETLGSVEVALGDTAELVNGYENFRITIKRIGARTAR